MENYRTIRALLLTVLTVLTVSASALPDGAKEKKQHVVPQDTANYLKADSCFRAGNIREGRRYLIRTLQINDGYYKAKRKMVDVEDTLKRYSSAICYINELLELQPYDRDLWLRKISLERKLGNHSEADAALYRLGRIFPNDTLVQHAIAKRRYDRWSEDTKRDSLSRYVDLLEERIYNNPLKDSNYYELIGIYGAMGEYDRAVATAVRGLKKLKNNPKARDVLAKKAIGLLVDRGDYGQALNMVKDPALKLNHPHLLHYLETVAQDARLHDAYEANAKLYAKKRDAATLNYLISTSVSRGYYDDAIYYLKEKWDSKRQKKPDSLWKHRYALELRMGHEKAAQSALAQYYALSPRDSQFVGDFIDMQLRLANQDIIDKRWREADSRLDSVLYSLMPIDLKQRLKKKEIEPGALPEYWPDAVVRKIMVTSQMGDYAAAGSVYKDAVRKAPQLKSRFRDAYDEVAIQQLQVLIADERYVQGRQEAGRMVACFNDSTVALPQHLNILLALNDTARFAAFAKAGLHAHPQEPYYRLKYVTALEQQHRYGDAYRSLMQYIRSDSLTNPLYYKPLAGITLQWAADTLNKAKTSHLSAADLQAVYRLVEATTDSVIRAYAPADNDLIYMRGVVREHLRKWRPAFDDQILLSRYNPGNAEQREYYQHRDYLEWRTLRDHLDLSYTYASYDTRENDLASTAHLYSIATAAYSHLSDSSTYTLQLSYKGIDGYHADGNSETGGAGVELMGQWEHQFDSRWSGMISASVANKYFNKLGANVSVSYAADNGWTPTFRLGYRRTPKTYLFLSGSEVNNQEHNLFIASPSVQKSWDERRIITSLSADFTLMESSLYYNVGAKGKLFFKDDNVSSVSLIAGIGTFPELSFFEQAALQGISHTNTMVGIDAMLLCSARLSVGLSGNWNTCYDPYRQADGSLTASYRNVYSLTAHLHVAF